MSRRSWLLLQPRPQIDASLQFGFQVLGPPDFLAHLVQRLGELRLLVFEQQELVAVLIALGLDVAEQCRGVLAFGHGRLQVRRQLRDRQPQLGAGRLFDVQLVGELCDRLLEVLQLGVLALKQLIQEELRQHEDHEHEDDDQEQRRERIDEARPDVGVLAQRAPGPDHRRYYLVITRVSPAAAAMVRATILISLRISWVIWLRPCTASSSRRAR